MDIVRAFFYSRFSSGKSQSQQKLVKIITHFSIQFCSNHISLDIESNMLPKQSQKPFSRYKFSSKHLVHAIKNIGMAPFLDAQELPSQSTLKANVCIFLYICLRKFLFRKRSKLLSGFIFNLLHNFRKAARCLGLAKYFTIFPFDLNFWKFNYISAFWYFHL